jgi:hypothetical protein
MKLNSLLNALGRFVSEAGSEQSTNFRWWDSRARSVLACRLDLNHPPTPVGGISESSQSRLSELMRLFNVTLIPVSDML